MFGFDDITIIPTTGKDLEYHLESNGHRLLLLAMSEDYCNAEDLLQIAWVGIRANVTPGLTDTEWGRDVIGKIERVYRNEFDREIKDDVGHWGSWRKEIICDGHPYTVSVCLEARPDGISFGGMNFTEYKKVCISREYDENQYILATHKLLACTPVDFDILAAQLNIPPITKYS